MAFSPAKLLDNITEYADVTCVKKLFYDYAVELTGGPIDYSTVRCLAAACVVG